MPHDVYRNTAPRRETPKARQAFADYAAMPAGERSLTKLLARYKTSAEHPPTRSLGRLKFWSQVWGWQQRLAVRDAEIEAARRQETLRQAEAQARENARLQQTVGSGALGVCAVALNRLVNSETGELVEPIAPRDLPALMRSGAELVLLSTGMPTQIVSNQGDATALELCLRESDEQTRATVLRGLRAAWEWQERHQRDGG